tara:strand:- start:392 stop:628 length:237 start_codon:yes stop_codon:yes gene_type:complete
MNERQLLHLKCALQVAQVIIRNEENIRWDVLSAYHKASQKMLQSCGIPKIVADQIFSEEEFTLDELVQICNGTNEVSL